MNPFVKTKILEHTIEVECTPNGTAGTSIRCGYSDEYNGIPYLFDDYTYIYLTLPAFSGTYKKINNEYKKSMVWKKVNNNWKRCLQYKKINYNWVQSVSSWRYEP
jgi:hypothetical protein